MKEQREEAPIPAEPARTMEPPKVSDPAIVLGMFERDLARHATPCAEPNLGSGTVPEVHAVVPPPPTTRERRRREADAELVRVHRLEQSALLRTAVDLGGAARFARWAFSAPTAAPMGLAAWRKLCDEELLFARLDGASVPDELHRLRVLDPIDFGPLASLARRALELERSSKNRITLARALVLDGELERAADILCALLERPATPRQCARLHTTLACTLEGLGEPRAALREHERALALGDDVPAALACLTLGFVLGDRPRVLFAVEVLERFDRRHRGATPLLQRAIRATRMRFELANDAAPRSAPELSSLALECLCDGIPSVAEATYQLFI